MSPTRIQLSRKRGGKLPPNTVNVARPSRWGNPFPVGKEGPLGRVAPDNAGAVGMFEDMLHDPEMRAAARYPADLSPLAGKNLACWCRSTDACHADVLLRISNPTVCEAA